MLLRTLGLVTITSGRNHWMGDVRFDYDGREDWCKNDWCKIGAKVPGVGTAHSHEKLRKWRGEARLIGSCASGCENALVNGKCSTEWKMVW